MADETKQLLIRIAATTELLKIQMTAAENSVERFANSAKRDLDKFDGSMGKLNKTSSAMVGGFKLAAGAAAGFIASIGIDTVIDATRRALDYAGSLGETAQQLGVTTKFMQEFRFAAEQNGASTESADNALAKFSLTLGKAFDGNKAAVKSFETLGISLKALRAADDSTRFALVADAIAKIPDPAQRAAAAVAIFGKGAREIIPILEGGSKAFRLSADEARRYGLILSDKQIQDADKTADKIAKLTKSLEVKFSGVVADNAAAIGEFADAIARLLDQGLKFQKNYPGIARALQGFAAGGPVGAAYNLIVGENPQATNKPRTIQGPSQPRAPFNPFTQPTPKPTGKLPLAAPGIFGIAGASFGGGFDLSEFIRATGAAADTATPQITRLGTALDSLPDGFFDGETVGSRVASSQRTLLDGIGDDGALGDMLDRQIDRLGDYFDEYERRGAETQRFLADQFSDLFEGGTNRVWENFQRIGLRVVAEVAAKMAISLFSGKGTGDIGGLFSSALGGILGFANGGEPPVGKVSMVGERGPELFIPKVPGTIISNDNLRGIGGGGTQLSVTINAPGATAETVLMIRREIRAAAPTLVGQSKRETFRSAGRRKL